MASKSIRIVLAFLVAASTAWPCGPFGQYTFLTYGGRDILAMPVGMFEYECRALINFPQPETADDSTPESTTLRQLTDDTDTREVREALGAVGEEDASHYKELRLALMNFAVNGIPASGTFDLGPYEEILGRLPEEFSLYIRGAAAYHAEDFDSAIAHFEAVLALPAQARPKRSTWAAFMLGKAWTQKEPARAAENFAILRKLAGEGFADSLKLARVSFGWQARAEMLSGHYLEAIHGYAQHARETGDNNITQLSLREVCERALAISPIDARLVTDDLARQILTAYVISHSGDTHWLAALESWTPAGEVPGADRLAWLAYQAGNMDLAERWLKFAPETAPYAIWVRAKLALRAGKLDEAAALLAQSAEAFAAVPSARVEDPMEEVSYSPVPAPAIVREELGFVQTKLGQYSEALRSFLQGGGWADAACIAERVLSSDELSAFAEAADNHNLTNQRIVAVPEMQDAYAPPKSLSPRLRYLLARRLARAGDWQRALQYYPEDSAGYWWAPGADTKGYLPKQAKTYSEHFQAGKDPTLPVRERAQHLIEAARILRADGMALVGTELRPDWALDGGSYPSTEIAADPASHGPLEVSEDFKTRFAAASAAMPTQFLHYRQDAADLMWNAANLLPDNDPTTAQALYLGGTYLAARQPKEADRFYKALVRRNPNLLIAQQADKLRWFPPEFSEVVVYQPYSKPWYGSRKIVFVAVAAGLTVLAAIVALRGARRSQANA